MGKLLGSYRPRAQKSVFEVMFKSEAERARIQAQAAKLIEPFDALHFYCLCANCQPKRVPLKASDFFKVQGKRLPNWPCADPQCIWYT
ncbi:MAG: CRISPR-associated endonuclease Cas2 [Gammaproteobacteria bacterium]|nr:CRISPR-associated endonuclease Cas2 [Gammaproteobacteria bacterium]